MNFNASESGQRPFLAGLHKVGFFGQISLYLFNDVIIIVCP